MSDNDFDDFTKGLLFTLMYMMLGTDEERQAIFEQLPMKGGDCSNIAWRSSSVPNIMYIRVNNRPFVKSSKSLSLIRFHKRSVVYPDVHDVGHRRRTPSYI